jgi:hypothetical protein
MKTITVLAAIVLCVSVGFATQTGHGELKELSFSLEGLPVYVQDVHKGPNESLTNEYKLDTTTLELLIKQSVDPDGWSNPGVKIAPTSNRGKDVLRIVQTPLNHERIADLLSRLRKASPNYVEEDEDLIGVPPTKAKQ